MRTNKNYAGLGMALAVAIGASLNANANITLQLKDTSSRAESGFTATFDGTSVVSSGTSIGIYKFAASGDISGTFWSTCLSPQGSLGWDSHSYTALSFAAADGGLNPDHAWAGYSQGKDWGIQNAQYLWRTYSSSIISGGTADQGAALHLAIWEALYDSKDYGQLTSDPGRFNVTTFANSTVQDYYNTYLNTLSKITTSDLATGSILRRNDYVWCQDHNGQDLMYNTTPVPEPTTMIAGALLLLPFGASTIRFLRKNRTA